MVQFFERGKLPGAIAVRIYRLVRDCGLTDRSFAAYFVELKRYAVCCMTEGEEITGFVCLDPNCILFGGSVRIVNYGYPWSRNTEERIADLLYTALSQIKDQPTVCMDVNTKRDFNVPVYEHMGFRRSIMVSPFQNGNTLFAASLDDLKNRRKDS